MDRETEWKLWLLTQLSNDSLPSLLRSRLWSTNNKFSVDNFYNQKSSSTMPNANAKFFVRPWGGCEFNLSFQLNFLDWKFAANNVWIRRNDVKTLSKSIGGEKLKISNQITLLRNVYWSLHNEASHGSSILEQQEEPGQERRFMDIKYSNWSKQKQDLIKSITERKIDINCLSFLWSLAGVW